MLSRSRSFLRALLPRSESIIFLNMSLAEIKTAVDQLSPKELAELAAFIRERDSAAWDREIDEDFSETGRLRRVLDEVRGDARAGRLEELP